MTYVIYFFGRYVYDTDGTALPTLSSETTDQACVLGLLMDIKSHVLATFMQSVVYFSSFYEARHRYVGLYVISFFG